jgi:hypothetical protein
MRLVAATATCTKTVAFASIGPASRFDAISRVASVVLQSAVLEAVGACV